MLPMEAPGVGKPDIWTVERRLVVTSTSEAKLIAIADLG